MAQCPASIRLPDAEGSTFYCCHEGGEGHGGLHVPFVTWSDLKLVSERIRREIRNATRRAPRARRAKR